MVEILFSGTTFNVESGTHSCIFSGTPVPHAKPGNCYINCVFLLLPALLNYYPEHSFTEQNNMTKAASSNRKAATPSIFIITGGNGITGNFIVQAVLAQFPRNKIPVVLRTDIINTARLEKAVNDAVHAGGIIVHTLVNQVLRDHLKNICKTKNCRTIDLMGELIDTLSDVLNEEPLNQPGLFRKSHSEYFDRLESIDFAINNDDGLNIENLYQADIVLTGVSRTGKTPLSVYLAMLGWKVSNVPIIKGIEPPQQLFEIDYRRVFGLTIHINQLLSHRRKRLAEYEITGESDYYNPRSMREELDYALAIFRKGRFSVINVSNKAIESSANEILRALSKRFEKGVRKLKYLPG
jgi:regulator of PEP synthase PpsR (kinase-PPPase family)